MKVGMGVLFCALVGAGLITGCGNHKKCPTDASYNPVINPSSFVSSVNNPLFPLVPGTKFIYRTPTEVVEVTVTPDRKVILGVSCTVVHDTVSVNGEVTEDTFDWYAQDASGAVWYFGEDTKTLSKGKVTGTEGSWEAGVDGAKPGIVMPPAPAVGHRYRQEYYACKAEDEAEVLSLEASVTVPAGSYTGCLQTHEFTRLEPDANERKYYSLGVGQVLTEDVSTGEREELIQIISP